MKLFKSRKNKLIDKFFKNKNKELEALKSGEGYIKTKDGIFYSRKKKNNEPNEIIHVKNEEELNKILENKKDLQSVTNEPITKPSSKKYKTPAIEPDTQLTLENTPTTPPHPEKTSPDINIKKKENKFVSVLKKIGNYIKKLLLKIYNLIKKIFNKIYNFFKNKFKKITK